ncbi:MULTISPECIES: hypothetical protein [unclassified Agarivorans]|uniref:hypothetical protein n=1 Tax=unclassified Agarivorans TaxID=2636026 RepID=UPI003D7CEECB
MSVNTARLNNGHYPEPVNFTEQSTVMIVAFEHQLNAKGLRYGKHLQAYVAELFSRHWRVHPYMAMLSDEHSDPKELSDFNGKPRCFFPKAIMTPQSHQIMFGETPFEGDFYSEADTAKFISERVATDVGSAQMAESLLFSLDSSQWIQQTLTLKVKQHNKAPLLLPFKIDWIDILLFGDGVGQLVFKVSSLVKPASISSVSLLNRTLRDFNDGDIQVEAEGAKAISFWDTFILEQCLGFVKAPKAKLGYYSPLLAVVTPSLDAEKVFDCFQRYCKLFVVAYTQHLDKNHELAWSAPISDPKVNYHENSQVLLNTGQWDQGLAASQRAIIAGYATWRDLIPFELACVSNEAASVGGDGPGWQYSAEYIRAQVEDNFIEVWEHWAGLVLRDSAVFVAYHDSMPIRYSAEQLYLPLYLLSYRNRFRLDCLSRTIIDHDMANVFYSKQNMEQFQRFRNHYWFREVTTDFLGAEVFNKFNQAFKLQQQYEVVSSEVAELGDYLEAKWQRRTKFMFAAILFFFSPIMSLNEKWLMPPEEGIDLPWVAMVLTILLLLYVVSRYFYQWIGKYSLWFTKLQHQCAGVTRKWLLPRLKGLLLAGGVLIAGLYTGLKLWPF